MICTVFWQLGSFTEQLILGYSTPNVGGYSWGVEDIVFQIMLSTCSVAGCNGFVSASATVGDATRKHDVAVFITLNRRFAE